VDRETLVAARYDIITAGENWVTVVASEVAGLPGLLGRDLAEKRDEGLPDIMSFAAAQE